MKKVLITGGGGFIGQELVKRLQRTDYEIFAPGSGELNIIDQNSFAVCEGQLFNHVIHLAAKTFVPDSWVNPSAFFDVNVGGTKNVLEYCRKQRCSLTYISAYLYGVPEKLPIAENSILQPNNPYAQSKLMAESLCEFYAREYGVTITVLRPFNIYGASQNDKFLIPSIIRQVLNEDVVKLKDLHPKRDYVYIKDLTKAIYLAMSKMTEEKEQYRVYNIGSGYSVSVAQIVDMIQGIMGTEKPVITEMAVRHNEINDVIADITQANRKLNWSPQYSLLDGLRETIHDYKGRCR